MDLLKRLQAIAAQVNPVDKDRTYDTVINPQRQREEIANRYPVPADTLVTKNLPTMGRGGVLLNRPAASSVMQFGNGPQLYDPTGQGLRNQRGWAWGGRNPSNYAAIPYDESAKPNYMAELPMLKRLTDGL